MYELLNHLPEQDYDEGKKTCQEIEEMIDAIDIDVALNLLWALYKKDDIESLKNDIAKIALLGTVTIEDTDRVLILGFLWDNILQPYFENESLFLKEIEPFIKTGGVKFESFKSR